MTATAVAPSGRRYSPAERRHHVRAACARVASAAEGCEWASIRAYCREHGIASGSLYAWMGRDEELAARYARAREAWSHNAFDELLNIVATEPQTAVQATWQRTRAAVIEKAIARVNARSYGDKAQLEHSGGIAIAVVTGVGVDVQQGQAATRPALQATDVAHRAIIARVDSADAMLDGLDACSDAQLDAML